MGRWYLIPVSELGFGRTDQPSGSPCANTHEQRAEMTTSGSLQQGTKEEGARALRPALHPV